ncbi:MAG: hypothetical protein GX826_06535, partial [Gammaproteobacteria bacterium]|nr:hypothetical protein [Gammaproteobacteria bacterium]
QGGVLLHAAHAQQVLATTRTPELIAALTDCGFFDQVRAGQLQCAHQVLLQRALACTLDGRVRQVPEDEALTQARATVRSAWRDCLRHNTDAESG